MNATSMNSPMKSLISKAAILATGAIVLAGFATITQNAERRAEHALDAAVAAPGKLYAAPTPTVQFATVVVTGKRLS